MEKEYKGIIIEESLEDRSVLDGLNVLSVKEEVDMDSSYDKWHLYTIQVSRDEIEQLQRYLKQGWYMHFWKGRDVIVVYRDKMFELNFDDKATWKDAVEYGKSLGIPDEQLDFLID